MSDTPRVDAEQEQLAVDLYVVGADFARELERELIAAKEKNTHLMGASYKTAFLTASKDTERLDWLERSHALHRGVDIWYVVDGYEVQLTYNDAPVGPCYHGSNLRDAIDAAIRAQES